MEIGFLSHRLRPFPPKSFFFFFLRPGFFLFLEDAEVARFFFSPKGGGQQPFSTDLEGEPPFPPPNRTGQAVLPLHLKKIISYRFPFFFFLFSGRVGGREDPTVPSPSGRPVPFSLHCSLWPINLRFGSFFPSFSFWTRSRRGACPLFSKPVWFRSNLFSKRKPSVSFFARELRFWFL